MSKEKKRFPRLRNALKLTAAFLAGAAVTHIAHNANESKSQEGPSDGQKQADVAEESPKGSPLTRHGYPHRAERSDTENFESFPHSVKRTDTDNLGGYPHSAERMDNETENKGCPLDKHNDLPKETDNQNTGSCPSHRHEAIRPEEESKEDKSCPLEKHDKLKEGSGRKSKGFQQDVDSFSKQLFAGNHTKRLNAYAAKHKVTLNRS